MCEKEKHMVLYEKKYKRDFMTEKELLTSGEIFSFGDGLYSYSSKIEKLYHVFNSLFLRVLNDFKYEKRKYPVLLPLDTYQKTNYLKTSPQYAMFCSSIEQKNLASETIPKAIEKNDILSICSQPNLALSPSACFHLYEELKKKKLEENKIFTFNQRVFREEGGENYSIYRLRDYAVREIVMIGDEEFVSNSREQLLCEILKLLDLLKLDYKIEIACDPFIVPEMNLYKKVQIANKVKYEVRISTSDSTEIACTSLNVHGNLFSRAFDFQVLENKKTVSGCVGFGFERWIIAFLLQHGLNEDEWPLIVKKMIKSDELFI